LQVAITGLPGLLGGADQGQGTRRVAQRPRVDGFLDPGGARSLDRTGIELLHLAQERHHQVALAELEGELGRGEQPPGARPGRAQLRGPLPRGEITQTP